jgi:predicted nuclease of restriction endonuclease-like RecB superfamily
MFPRRLLDVRRGADGTLVPRWLTARDEVWLRELAAEAAASGGRRVGAGDARILDVVAPIAQRHGVGRRTVEAVWRAELRRWTSRVEAPLAPPCIRRVVFDLAAERSRDEALEMASTELGLSPTTILDSLFADRARARVRVAPTVAASAADLASSYNLVLAQSLLCRSTEVTAVVRANLRSVVRFAKLMRLMVAFDEAADGATRVTVSGPLALFHDTLKYGRALAAWFPSVVSTPGWSVAARILLGGDPCRLLLDATAPIPPVHALPSSHDSRLEAWLERDLRALSSPWRLVRESSVVRQGARLCFPDFTLVSDLGRVLVEVVGYWTRDYLARKAALLAAVDVPIVLCVDASHAGEDFPEDPRIVRFERRIDAAAVIAAGERACALPRRKGPRSGSTRRHYLVIPDSGTMRHYAVRAGAHPGTWRGDVCSDLAAEPLLRVLLRPTHPEYGPQLEMIGRKFRVEVNPHRGRDDALFVHRVTASNQAALSGVRLHSASLDLADTRSDPPRRDPVGYMFT